MKDEARWRELTAAEHWFFAQIFFIHLKTMLDCPGAIYPRVCRFFFPSTLARCSWVLHSRQVGSLFHNNSIIIMIIWRLLTGWLLFQDAHDAAQIHPLLHDSRERRAAKRPGTFPSTREIWIPIRFKLMHSKKEYTPNVYQLKSEHSSLCHCKISNIKLFRKSNTKNWQMSLNMEEK